MDIDVEGWLEYRAPAWLRRLLVRLSDWIARRRQRRMGRRD